MHALTLAALLGYSDKWQPLCIGEEQLNHHGGDMGCGRMQEKNVIELKRKSHAQVGDSI